MILKPLAPPLVHEAAIVEVEKLPRVEYRVLATSKTSTMEKELNEAAEAGFRFLSVMGAQTAVGGKEVGTVMGRSDGTRPRYQYKLVAITRRPVR